ncbi:hypothetical protein EZV62_020427 [Acer yangbiense]|uniref:PGG domain-containing protein n=1 Tax=Acer yangbiense TaxID=1000413 RepID=A0A5C7HE28_9ROSI|nr:hypothetical protein EZV62_020427 [Acer yangbiense]
MEPAHFEAALNGEVNKFPFCEIQRVDLSETFNKVSPSGNSLLHVASSSGHGEMTQLIARNFPLLITKQNSKGNTALHLAVRAQKLNTVRALVDLSKQNPNTSTDTLLTMKKMMTEIQLYMKLCKSPLCMAVESGNKAIVEYILNALPDQPRKVSCMLRIIKEQKEELLLLGDEEGNTPLHFAAYIGCSKGVRYLLEFKSQNILHAAVKSGKDNMVRYVLKRKDTDNLVNETDKNGNTPFHLAALLGHSMVVFTLLCDKRSKVDVLNYQGRTIKASRPTIFLKQIYLQRTRKLMMCMIETLKRASGVEENSVEVDLKKSKKLEKFQMMMVYSMLYIYYEHFQRLWQIIRRHHHSSTKMSHIKIKPPVPKQDLNNTINYLFVVAALVVGVAFAGVLQIPYDSSTDNVGNVPAARSDSSQSQMDKKSILSLFLFTNILTMNLAVIAAFGLFLALLLDANLGSILVSVSFLLLELSLTYMGSAFLYAMQLRMKIIGDQLYLTIILDRVLAVFQLIQKVLVIISLLVFTLGREELPFQELRVGMVKRMFCTGILVYKH